MQTGLSVSQFNELVKNTLGELIGEINVYGEVADFKISRDSLVYFELKDKKSRVLCFAMIWELKVEIENGMEVQITGTPSLFQTSGMFHVRVSSITLLGQGSLLRAFQILQAKLTTEGLFNLERKRPLPTFPNTIGIITSKDAAAYTDILRILNNRWTGLQIYLAPVAVQGPSAESQIVRAIKYLNQQNLVDVIILTRGGGSLADLQAFNLESVARAIFGSKIPVLTGIGHERDITIADLVADCRASTPTNAAMIVVPDRLEIQNKINNYTHMAHTHVSYIIKQHSNNISNYVDKIEYVFAKFSHRAILVYEHYKRTVKTYAQFLLLKSQTILNLNLKLITMIQHNLQNAQRDLDHKLSLLNNLNPLTILSKGYSITYLDNLIIKDISQVQPGDIITTQLYKGKILSKTTDIQTKI